ncbi:hypothetical protein TRVL_05970 [Trypanosoma vivax]|nr:hypothetical protein TRVL_05970 [Trypanosoma vivax]
MLRAGACLDAYTGQNCCNSLLLFGMEQSKIVSYHRTFSEQHSPFRFPWKGRSTKQLSLKRNSPPFNQILLSTLFATFAFRFYIGMTSLQSRILKRRVQAHIWGLHSCGEQ